MTDRLTFRRDAETGNWIASFNHYYHSAGISKDQAVQRLREYLTRDYPDAEAEARPWFQAYFAPKENPMTDLKTDWERRADIEAEERRMKQIAEADALAEIQRLGQEIEQAGKKP